VEWNEQGFINTSDTSHRVNASQGLSHRNRKAHFFIQPSINAFDPFICQKLIRLHLACPLALTDTGVVAFQVPRDNSLRLPGFGIAL
jgi:hypothetical protein